MRLHRFFAEAKAWADNVCADQARYARVDMHHSAAGKIQRAPLPQQACGCVQFIHDFGVNVSIRTLPEPHHVRNRQIGEGEPDDGEYQHCRELDALGKRTEDQAAGDGGERCLEGNKHQLRQNHAFAEGADRGEIAFHRVNHCAFQE